MKVLRCCGVVVYMEVCMYVYMMYMEVCVFEGRKV